MKKKKHRMRIVYNIAVMHVNIYYKSIINIHSKQIFFMAECNAAFYPTAWTNNGFMQEISLKGEPPIFRLSSLQVFQGLPIAHTKIYTLPERK